MFNRQIKKQFNSAKYKYLANPAHQQSLNQGTHSFVRSFVGAIAIMLAGFNYTKRYYEFPHMHKDTSKPMVLPNGELHPLELQPPSAHGMKVYDMKM